MQTVKYIVAPASVAVKYAIIELMLNMVIVLLIILLADLIVAYRLRWAFTHFSPKKVPLAEPPEDELPSVTVCIPARNEKHAMTACLEAVVASTYPKLEIIVLDDGSRDDTSVVIKSFAHEGVRFVEGSPLPAGWLGKNHALDTLMREASGHYILFMDVDTRIEPQTVGQLVAYAKSEKADMVSVLPRRHDSWRASVVFATMRFFWEIALKTRAHPPVASTAWMITRHVLEDELGGLAACATATRPEAEIAKRLASTDRYRFVMSEKWLGLRYEKKWASQMETSLRLTFPFLGYSWLRTAIALMILLLVLVPYGYMGISAMVGSSMLFGLAFAVGLLQMGLYGWFVSKVWERGWIIGGLLLPLSIAIEIWIVSVSAYRYQTGKITWKGRPIQTLGAIPMANET